MQIIKRIFIYLFLIFCIVIALLFILFKTQIITSYLTDYLTAELYKRTGKNIKIGSVELGVVNNLVIKNVSIPVKRTFSESGEFINIGKIIIRFNLIDILRQNGTFEKSFSKIIIDSPIFYITKQNNNFNISDFINGFKRENKNGGDKSFPVLPINIIFIENGKIIYEDKDIKFFNFIESISGNVLFDIKKNMLDIKLDGKIKKGLKNNLKLLTKYYIEKKKINAKVMLDTADISLWLNYLLDNTEKPVKNAEVEANLDIISFDFKPETTQLNGFIKIINGDILKNNVPVKNINGDLSILKDRIIFNNLNFKIFESKAIIKGELKDIFNKFDYNVDFVINNFNLSDIDNKILTGNARATFNFSGNKSKFSGNGNLFLDSGKIANMPLKDIESEVLISDGILNLKNIKGKFADGVLDGTVKLNFSKNNDLKGNISLQKVSFKKLINDMEASGDVNFLCNLDGFVNNPEIKIFLKSDFLRYREYVFKNIKNEIVISNKKTKISAEFNYGGYDILKLSGNIVFNGNKVLMDNFHLIEKTNELLKINGFYLVDNKDIDVSVDLSDIVLSKLKLKYFEGKNIEAIINGQARISGKIDNPIFDLFINTKKLLIRDENYKFSGNISFGQNMLKFKNLNFNNNLVGAAEFSLRKKLFNIGMDIKNFNGNVLDEIFNLGIFKDGIINGTAKVNKTNDGYGGYLSINTDFKEGVYKSFITEIDGESNIFKINKIEIKQKKGFFNVAGNLEIKDDKDLILNLYGNAINFKINDKLKLRFALENNTKIVLNEENVLSSNFIKFSDIKFNENKIENLIINFKTENKDITSLRADLGNLYSLNGNFYIEKEPKISLRFDFKESDFYPIFALLNFGEKKLEKEAFIKGYAQLNGSLNNTDFDLYVSQEKGIFKTNGKIAFLKDKNFFKPDKVNCKYSFTNCDLKNFLSIFLEKVKDTGSLNGTGEIRGSVDNLLSDGSLILTNGNLFGNNYDVINFDYSYNNKKLKIIKGILNYKNQQMDFTDSKIEFKDKNDYYVDAKLNLKDFAWNSNKLNGNINFAGEINNNKNFMLNGSISSDNFSFRRHTFLPFIINVNFANDELNLKTSSGISSRIKNKVYANIKFLKDKIFVKDFSIENDTHKFFQAAGLINKEEGNSDLKIEMFDYNPQVLNDLMDWPHQWSGSLNGNVKISKNLKQGLAYTIFLNISNGSFNNLQFDLLTGLFSLKDHWLDISPAGPAILAKEGKYEIKAKGKIPSPTSKEGDELVRGAEMDVDLEIKNGDLSIIKFLSWVDDAEGKIDANLKIKGTKQFPSISGKINITDGSASFKYLFKDIKHIFANILIKDNIIDIYNLKGDCGKGTIKISNLNEKKGGTLKDYKIYETNWKITNIGDRIKVSDTKYMEFLDGDADINLEMTGLMESPLIKGDIKLYNTKYTYPTKIKGESGDEVKEMKYNYAKQINWDVNVYCKENFMYYSSYGNNYAEVYIKPTDLPIIFKGKGNDLQITGNASIQRGGFKYMNTDFSFDEMRESKVVFDGDRRPILDIYAKSKLRKITLKEFNEEKDIDIYLKAYGRVGDVKIDVSSDPQLEKNRIFYILTFGADVPQGIDITKLGKDASMLAADALANYWLKIGGQEIKKRTPLDYVDIKLKASDFLGGDNKNQPTVSETPSGTTQTSEAAGTTPAAKQQEIIQIGMGKYLTDQLYLGYDLKLFKHGINLNLNQTAEIYDLQHILGLEYSLDNTKKLKFYRTFGSPNLGLQDETFLGIESRISFESWATKKEEK